MGNVCDNTHHLTKDNIHTKILARLDSNDNDIFHNYMGKKLSDLATLTFNAENELLINEINRNNEIINPANHLKRLKYIWILSPLPEITKMI